MTPVVTGDVVELLFTATTPGTGFGDFVGTSLHLDVTPEPTSLGLFCLGGIGILARRRRRQLDG